MNFLNILFFIYLFRFCYAQDIVCEIQISYIEQICYTYDYQSPECGPYLLNCPIIGASYSILCSSYVCKVILLIM